MFEFSVTSTATLVGTANKRVECEKCRVVFQYTLERTATAKKSAPFLIGVHAIGDLAVEAAKQKLAKRLVTAVDAVPCPMCGWVQAEMNVAEVERRFGWVRTAPYYLMLVALVLSLPCWLLANWLLGGRIGSNAKVTGNEALVNALTCALAVMVPTVFYFWVRQRARRFDMNERVPEAKRIAEGRRLAKLVTAPDGVPDAQPWRPISRAEG